MEGKEWGDMEVVSAGASLRDLDIDRGGPASLMSTVNGLQDVRQGSRGSYPGRDGDLSLRHIHTGCGAPLRPLSTEVK